MKIRYAVALLGLAIALMGARFQRVDPVTEAARQKVLAAGFTPDDARYEGPHPLWVVIGTKRGKTGVEQRAFFFSRDKLVGNDAPDTSAKILPLWHSADEVAILYALYHTTDPLCCPTGGGAIARFHLAGDRLVTQDSLPPSSPTEDLSRR